jgi:hypothetical protein
MHIVAGRNEGQKRTTGVDGLLTGELIQHLTSASKSVTRLTNANVDDELLNAKLAHGVVSLLLLLIRLLFLKSNQNNNFSN